MRVNGWQEYASEPYSRQRYASDRNCRGMAHVENEKVTVASEANICFQTGKDMGEVTGVVTSPIVLPNWKDSFAGNTCAGEINDGSSAVAAGDG